MTSPARACEGLHHAVHRGGLLTLGGAGIQRFRDSQWFWLTFFTWASLIFSSATRIFSAFALAACSSCGWHNDMLTKKHSQSITFIHYWGMRSDRWISVLHISSLTCPLQHAVITSISDHLKQSWNNCKVSVSDQPATRHTKGSYTITLLMLTVP